MSGGAPYGIRLLGGEKNSLTVAKVNIIIYTRRTVSLNSLHVKLAKFRSLTY